MTNNITIKINDYSEETLNALKNAIERGLDSAGHIAENHTVEIIDKNHRIDTTRYITSIAHKVENNTCYVGTNVEYAIYNEVGTRKMKGIHAVKNGVADKKSEIINTIKESLRNA